MPVESKKSKLLDEKEIWLKNAIIEFEQSKRRFMEDLSKFEAEKAQFDTQNCSQSLLSEDLKKREQYILKRENDAEKMIDELRIKSILMEKLSGDIKAKEKLLSAKFVILTKKERDLEIREVKLEDRQDALKTSLNL